jgi:hypothetical protein
MSPATLVVVLLVGLLLAAGLLILVIGGRASAGHPCPQPGCEHRNPPEARFCRKCGRPLDPHIRTGGSDAR